MKIKKIILNGFKRFTDLIITDIPETARLIVLVGPNGSGKTSLFEALNFWYKIRGFNDRSQQDYFNKKGGMELNECRYDDKVIIEFYNNETPSNEQVKGKFYFRTAYRNEPDFMVSSLNKQKNPTEAIKLANLTQNDQTVSENYQRLVAQTLTGVYDPLNNMKTVEQLREELIGAIKCSLLGVFDNLSLSSIGDPLLNGSFYFEKGSTKDFHYKNLSAGEKSAFDLLLDILIKSAYYSDGVFCI